MGRRDKILEKVLSGRSDANIGFDELRNLLKALGFSERTRGGHHMFTIEGVEDLVNLQREGAKALRYQVKQVRTIIIKFNLSGEEEK
jgi:hypothetical protein